ncbi:hematopoietic prostaglandin D synthase-like [Panulirus ornatus]|uniref:hematopoietic prostaglandin D synthase-like n=1 Tax=Panulirus ornatus TaxID=150431 RepID=UPI003A841B16
MSSIFLKSVLELCSGVYHQSHVICKQQLSSNMKFMGQIRKGSERCDEEPHTADIPGGKLPVLVVDDKTLPQSLAIARYLAKQAGLVPQDDLDAAFCDALADTLYEITSEGYKIMFSSMSEEEKKKEYKENFFPKLMAPALERLNKRLSEREWFVSDKMTWADLIISLVFGEVKMRKEELLEPYPTVVALIQKVRAVPTIKQWLDTAPDTPF